MEQGKGNLTLNVGGGAAHNYQQLLRGYDSVSNLPTSNNYCEQHVPRIMEI